MATTDDVPAEAPDEVNISRETGRAADGDDADESIVDDVLVGAPDDPDTIGETHGASGTFGLHE